MTIQAATSVPDTNAARPHVPPAEPTAFVDASVREALVGLRNGQVTITVHNGDVVQIDRILRNRQFKSRSRK